MARVARVSKGFGLAKQFQYDTLELPRERGSFWIMRTLSGLLLLVVTAGASPEVVDRASALYQRTDYANSLKFWRQIPPPMPAIIF